jgi:hypothetical protein
MSARLLSHLRSHAIAYLALFVALSGSAYAVTAPKNSVRSKSIKNGEVRSIDLQDNGVASTDIQDGGVGSADLADGAVEVGDLDPGAVGARGFAKIAANGNVIASRNLAGVQHTGGSSTYCLTWTFTPQVAVASADAGAGTLGADAQIQIPGGPAGAGCNANEVAVVTEAGSPVTGQPFGFYIIVN